MKLRILVVISIISMTTAQGQTVMRGKVQDEFHHPLPGASVYLKGSYDGTSTDKNGLFLFRTEKRGLQWIIVSFIGYQEYVFEVELKGDTISYDIILEEIINRMEGLTITAGNYEAGPDKRNAVLKPLDIVTTAGATADIAGALNTLPGTQVVGEEGKLFVRGGEGRETKVFIDGLQVLEFYSPSADKTPSRSRFLPFMFGGTSFSTGGYSAEYGQALSSTLDLTTKQIPEQSRADIGILSVGMDASYTHTLENSSLSGKVFYTDLHPYYSIIKQNLDWVNSPTSYGYDFLVRKKGRNGFFKFYSNLKKSVFSFNDVNLNYPTTNQFVSLDQIYAYQNATWKTFLNDWSIFGGYSFSYIQDKAVVDTMQQITWKKGHHFKVGTSRDISANCIVNSGLELIDNRRDKDHKWSKQQFKTKVDDKMISGFIEPEIYVNEFFMLRPGLRVEWNSIGSAVSVDPRISLVYKIKSSLFSIATGRYRQSPKYDYVEINKKLKQENSFHFIFNFQWEHSEKLFRCEIYDKRYTHLVKFGDLNPSNAVTYDNSGDGYARGIDIFWRDKKFLRNAEYWISYSFIDSKRLYLDYPVKSTPAFISRHSIKAVFKHFIPLIKTQYSSTIILASPRPYNDPNSIEFNGGRTPAYFDLSASISYLLRSHIIIHVSLSNLLGKKNIFGYEFSTIPDENGFYPSHPVIQPAPRFLLIAVFITFAKNGNLNQLPYL